MQLKRPPDIAHARMQQQQISATDHSSIPALVEYMGAIQSQDYGMSAWAIGLRLPGTRLEDVETALDKGTIIRTHVLRPTWHIVAAKDIYWMLSLSAEKIKTLMRPMDRQLGLTEKIYTRSNRIIEKALSGGEHLSRAALASALQAARIATDENRMAHLLVRAELDAIICSGTKTGNQRGYALLANRVPRKQNMGKEEALALLAKRYFSSHGPATVQDFSWWSGLTLTAAGKALASVEQELAHAKIKEQQYWFSPTLALPAKRKNSIYFLPAFDEFIMGYRDRTASLPPIHQRTVITTNGIFYPTILINGQVSGTWKRTVEKKQVVVQTRLFDNKKTLPTGISKQLKRLQVFLGSKGSVLDGEA
ncbi:MAG TPA: winged helix DNA-binding domain-containing protein [Chitinophagaceae bacterium]|nr:winged helix DNA-binding domain-containing protein [Chitinophagaceae bacterium]